MTARVIISPIGTFTAAVEDGAIVALVSGAQQVSAWEPSEDRALLDRLERQLTEYARGQRTTFDVPICFTGTPFQSAVWKALVTIPYGETRTYGEVAAQIGHPKSCRAVGSACGKNPLLLLVPCHRVVGAKGGLTGFAAGLPLKETLLRLEQSVTKKRNVL